MKVKKSLIIIALLIMIGGCEEFLESTGITKSIIQQYFPLTVGAEWNYKITSTMYDETGTVPEDVYEITATTRITETTTKSGVETYVLKIINLSFSELWEMDPEDISEINTFLESFKIFVAYSETGISLHGLEGYYESEYYSEYNNVTYYNEIDFQGFFTKGIVILPESILAEEPIEGSGYLNYNSWDVDESTGEKISEYKDNYSFSVTTTLLEEKGSVSETGGYFDDCRIVESTFSFTNDWEDWDYVSDTYDSYSSTMSGSGKTYFAKGIGMVKAEISYDWGEAEDNAYMIKSVVVELISYSGL